VTPYGVEVTPYELVTARLKALGSRRMGKNWQCLAHDDRTPSLTVTPSDDLSMGKPSVLMHCHAGCPIEEVCGSLGLELSDLFPENGHRQGQLFPLSRYSPVGLDILLKLPPDSSRSFVVASALGRFVSISGGREHVYSQRHITAVIVETRHRKAILSVLGISSNTLTNQIREWRERGIAHACSQRLLTIFVRESTRCPVCKSTLLNVVSPSESTLEDVNSHPESTPVDVVSVPNRVITDDGFFKGVRGKGVGTLKASKPKTRWESLYPEGDGGAHG
jgi:hypothetical protein